MCLRCAHGHESPSEVQLCPLSATGGKGEGEVDFRGNELGVRILPGMAKR